MASRAYAYLKFTFIFKVTKKLPFESHVHEILHMGNFKAKLFH